MSGPSHLCREKNSSVCRVEGICEGVMDGVNVTDDVMT